MTREIETDNRKSFHFPPPETVQHSKWKDYDLEPFHRSHRDANSSGGKRWHTQWLIVGDTCEKLAWRHAYKVAYRGVVSRDPIADNNATRDLFTIQPPLGLLLLLLLLPRRSRNGVWGSVHFERRCTSKLKIHLGHLSQIKFNFVKVIPMFSQ